MKKLVINLLPVLALLSCASPQPENHGEGVGAQAQQPRFYATWPVLAPGQTRFVITPEFARLNVGTLTFPDYARFTVAPGVTSIEWSAQTIEIGLNAILDLSPPLVKPPTPPQPPAEMQADYCAKGNQGARGYRGTDGLHGVDLTIKDVQTINNSGALWIVTDGGPSGDGGRSGDGQQGGGAYGGLGGGGGVGGCQGKTGGRPGYSSDPGTPGRTSVVKILNLVSKQAPECPGMLRGEPPISQKNSNPPPEFSANAGTISLYGSPGCRGIRGPFGKQGADG